MQLEDLEIENEKLKSDLAVLRESLAMGDPGTKELLNQFRASEKELGKILIKVFKCHVLFFFNMPIKVIFHCLFFRSKARRNCATSSCFGNTD